MMKGKRSIGEKMRHGVIWMSIGQAASRIFTVAAGVILARLLFPEDYGLNAMAATFSGLVGLLGSIGVGKMLIQQHENFDEYANAGLRINILLGIGLFILQTVSASFVGEFFGDSRVSDIIMVSAIGYLIWPIGSIHGSILIKTMEFKKKVIAVSISAFLVSGLSIIFAFAGFGVWSFVIPPLLVAPIEVLMNWYLVPWRPSRTKTAQYWKPMFQFGGNIMAVNLLFYFRRKVDVLLVGKFLGVKLVGLYSFGLAVGAELLTKMVQRSGEILYPALSEMKQDRNDFETGFIKLTSILALSVVPIIFLLSAVASEMIVGIYGEKWIEATVACMVLCMGLIFSPLEGMCRHASNAVGRPDFNMKWTLATTPPYILSLIVGMQYGLVGLAAARSTFSVISGMIWIYICVRMLKLQWKIMLEAAQPGFISSIVMFMGLMLLKITVIQNLALPIIIQFMILCIVGIGMYLVTLRIFYAQQFRILVVQFQKFLPEKIRFFDTNPLGAVKRG